MAVKRTSESIPPEIATTIDYWKGWKSGQGAVPMVADGGIIKIGYIPSSQRRDTIDARDCNNITLRAIAKLTNCTARKGLAGCAKAISYYVIRYGTAPGTSGILMADADTVKFCKEIRNGKAYDLGKWLADRQVSKFWEIENGGGGGSGSVDTEPDDTAGDSPETGVSVVVVDDPEAETEAAAEAVVNGNLADGITVPRGKPAPVSEASASLAKITKYLAPTIVEEISEIVGRAQLEAAAASSERDKLRVELAEAKANAVAMIVKPVLVGEGGKIEIAGENFKQLNTGTIAHVPSIDLLYNFKMFNAKITAAQFVKTLLAGTIMVLVGEPAVSKTSLPIQIGARLNVPVVRMQCHSGLHPGDIWGTWEMVASESGHGVVTRYTYGPLTQAMTANGGKGGIIIIDEWDKLTAETAEALKQVLENAKSGVTEYGLPDGKSIKPGPHFRIVLTANTSGWGDEVGGFVSSRQQDLAVVDRVGAMIRVNYADMKIERDTLMRKTGLNKETASKLVSVANVTREARLKGDRESAVTFRQLLAVGELVAQGLDLETALEIGMIDKCPSRSTNNEAHALRELLLREGLVEGAPTP